MTVTTVFSNAGDGYLQCGQYLGTYANSRNGTNTIATDTASATLTFGQQTTNNCDLGYIDFDTSGVPDTDTVSAAALSLYDAGLQALQAFSAEAVAYDWGGTLTSADWIDGATWAAKTRLATLASAAVSASAYNAMVEDGANFQGAINKTGTTSIALGSDRFSAGSAPVTTEYWSISSADVAGTTQDPKIDITHAAGGSTVGGPLAGGAHLATGGVLLGRLAH